VFSVKFEGAQRILTTPVALNLMAYLSELTLFLRESLRVDYVIALTSVIQPYLCLFGLRRYALFKRITLS
jgi:hypothetical protein